MKLILLIVLAILSINLYESSALGLGAFISSGYTSAYNNINDKYGFTNTYTDLGFGFVLDTKVAEDKVFNYRLNFGLESSTAATWDEYYDIHLLKFALDNTLGFAVFKNSDYRVWMGPTIRFGVLYGTGGVQNTEELGYFLGIGASAGMNYHVFDRMSLSFETGVRMNGILGAIENNQDNNTYTGIHVSGDPVWGDEVNVFAKLSFLFRMGSDDFSKKFRGSRR